MGAVKTHSKTDENEGGKEGFLWAAIGVAGPQYIGVEFSVGNLKLACQHLHLPTRRFCHRFVIDIKTGVLPGLMIGPHILDIMPLHKRPYQLS